MMKNGEKLERERVNNELRDALQSYPRPPIYTNPRMIQDPKIAQNIFNKHFQLEFQSLNFEFELEF